jgi:hypothetical protein
MSDFRDNLSPLRRFIANIGLYFLRKAGKKKIRYQTTEERRASYIEQLIEAKYHLEYIQPWQIRIDGVLDIYPKSGRFFYLPKKEWGEFTGKNIATFVRKKLGEF